MRKWGLLLLLCALGLSACKFAGGEGPAYNEQEKDILTYACLNPVESTVKRFIDTFNKNHEDVQIEVRDYSDEGGPERLLVELMAGRVPDIMELQQKGDTEYLYGFLSATIGELDRGGSENGFWMPYKQLVQKGYLEDLWPYLENDPDLGREGVIEQPLKAAEVDGGLYMLFQNFYIYTLMGPRRVVGDRYTWTFDEFMEAYSTMPPASTVLQYSATKSDVFFHLLAFTLDRFVDWDTGENTFDSDEFRNTLEFLTTFPDEFQTTLSNPEVIRETIGRIFDGEQMLHIAMINMLTNVANADYFFTEPASFVGYPTGPGHSGSLFYPCGAKLAMSSNCQNKEAAWDFMRQLIIRCYNSSKMEKSYQNTFHLFPINRLDFDLGNRVEMSGRVKEIYWFNWNLYDISRIPDIDTAPPTENDLKRLNTLVENTTQLYWPDDGLSNIVWESIGPYLAGDKTMDETIRLLDNRVTLYVNELR